MNITERDAISTRQERLIRKVAAQEADGKAYPDSLPDIGCYECDIPKPGLLLQVW